MRKRFEGVGAALEGGVDGKAGHTEFLNLTFSEIVMESRRKPLLT